MLLPALLLCCVLLGPASSSISPSVPAVESTPPLSATSAATASAGTADADPPTAESQASHVTLGQVIATLSEFQRASARDVIAEPLAQLANTLASVQAGVTAMSERLDLLHNTQLQQQKTQTVVQQQLDAIKATISRIPKIVLGKACSSDTDCSRMLPEAVCGSSGRCRCRDGYRQVSDTVCRGPSRLTEWCLEDADCQTLVSNTVCSRGKCGCASGFWSHNNTECRQVSVVSKDGLCVGDQDCDSSLHLRCVSGACACPVRATGGYEYRLVGGSACNEGNVELRRDGGTWGVVCDDSEDSDDNWGTKNANVICRSLGFRSGSPTMESRYGQSANFFMDNVHCDGTETHLMNCSYLGWGVHNCGEGEVAGAQCS